MTRLVSGLALIVGVLSLVTGGAVLIISLQSQSADMTIAHIVSNIEQAADSGDWQTANGILRGALQRKANDTELLAWRQAVKIKDGELSADNWLLCSTPKQCTDDGLVLIKLQLSLLAQKTARQLMVLMPDDPTGSYLNGASFEQLNDIHDAYAAYKMALDLSGNKAEYATIHAAAAAKIEILQTSILQ